MTTSRSGRDNLFGGLLLILLGGLFLLDNLDVADFGDVFVNWWPLMIVALGVSHLLSSSDRGNFGNYILIIVGLFLLAINHDWFRWRIIGDLWPLVLIGIGAKLLFDAIRRRQE